jgi:hypothetical protein
MARNYEREYLTYQGTAQQKKNRAQRNAARAKMMKAGKVKKGDGKDVAHVKAFDKGGDNKTGLRVESKSANRSFDRDASKNLISETSPRERKRKK